MFAVLINCMTKLLGKYIDGLREELHAYALVRRDVIKGADDAIHHAKRAIFALHRGNAQEAKEKLAVAEGLLKGLQEKYKKHPRSMSEGAYRAAMEEYVEATLFYQFVTTGAIGKITAFPVDGDTYLSGLADIPGELYRYAIRAATNRDMAMVEQCAEMTHEIVGTLMEFDLTSYLRTKGDQAKQAESKLEQVVYEVSLRKS